jgi:GrpB-like predicted nucleotidyltransferase (UPF0157 family)
MKKIEVVPYDPSWPLLFVKEEETLKKALSGHSLVLHHVGSTSVPGLCAKPKIDIIGSVDEPEKVIEVLEKIGYEFKGEYNIPLHWGFAYRKEIEVNLHLYRPGNAEIALNLLFRDYLKAHDEVRDAYANLKYQILKAPESHQKDNPFFRRYTLEKGAFIKEVLKKAGWNQDRLVFCAEDQEWAFFHACNQASQRAQGHEGYDQSALDFSSPDFFRFILYHGVEKVGAAQCQKSALDQVKVLFIWVPQAESKKEYKELMDQKIEEWVISKKWQLVR